MARLRSLCEAFVVDPTAPVDVDLAITTIGDAAPKKFIAWHRGEPIREASTPMELASRIEWWLCNEAVQRSAALLHMHAGAASKAGAAILLPALSGTGKSTLTLGLLGRGFDLLSDDVAFIDPATRSVLPFWRSFHLDVHSIWLLGQAGVRFSGARATQYTFPPSTFGLRRPPPPAALRYVVFPQREGLRSGELVPMGQAEAAVAMLPLTAPLRRGEPGALERLRHCLSGCACFRLGSADLGRALDALAGLVSRRD